MAVKYARLLFTASKRETFMCRLFVSVDLRVINLFVNFAKDIDSQRILRSVSYGLGERRTNPTCVFIVIL